MQNYPIIPAQTAPVVPLAPTAVLPEVPPSVPRVQQAAGFIDKLVKADTPCLGKSRDEAEVTTLMDKIGNISDESDLSLAKKLTAVLVNLYAAIAQRSGKSVNCEEYFEALSEWTPEQVAKKFLLFCNENNTYFTQEDVLQLYVFPSLIISDLTAFGELEAYLEFNTQWAAMTETVVQRLERKS